MATKKTKKRRKPKGKSLSEQLKAKQEARQAEDEAAAEDDDEPSDDDGDDDGASLMAAALADGDEALRGDLASEPPPSYEGGDDEEANPFARDRDADEGDDEDEDEDEDDGRDDGEGDEADEDDEELAAAQMGHQRYVIAGFFGLWMVVSYVVGRTIELVWSRVASKDWFAQSDMSFLRTLAAVDPDPDRQLFNRVSISLMVGAVLAGLAVLRYYTREDVRTWADEVAEELAKVKWPTRKEVGNNTVVVIAASAVITIYLTLLDRFWSFVTTLIYSSGA